MSQLGEQAQRLFPHGVASLDFSVTEGGGFNTRVLAAGEGATRVFEARVASFDIAADDAVPDYLQIGSDDTIPEDAEPTERSGFDIAASAAAPIPVDTALPLPVQGLYGTHAAERRFGTKRTIEALLEVGRTFSTRHNGLRIGIGDISKRGGGQISGHASHRKGVDVDVRLIRNDGREAGCRYQDAVYSRALTQDLVNTFRNNSIFPVKFIFFNDPQVRGVSQWPNHDNHLHVRFDEARAASSPLPSAVPDALLFDRLSVQTGALAAAAKHLQSGASVPRPHRAEILEALNRVAATQEVDPAAIAGVIHTESVWDTHCVTGRYIGLTQVGPEFLDHINMNKQQFLALPPQDQISAYGQWLDSYRYRAKMREYNLRVPTFPVARQAAILQAMQFSPNGTSWKVALASGDSTVPSTRAPQARFLGDTSIGDMERYYSGFFQRYPPVYA